MYLPTTKAELLALGWERPDIILVTGDSYIDSPFIGVSLIGKILLDAGYNTAIIAQPDVGSPDDIRRLGEPALFWGVTGGCVDSMVANRTASGKRRKRDDYTPGGLNNRRPDRAVIAYSNLIRRHFKNTVPIVLGGIEASLRRVAHYDFWSNKIRRSILFDAKADYLLYGMADKSVLELAAGLRYGLPETRDIRGLSRVAKERPDGCVELPAFEEAASNKQIFAEMFKIFYANNDPVTAKPLVQKHGDRWLVQNPPARYLSTEELDSVHALEFHRDAHPHYAKQGEIRALETIRFSITTHRGCYGECNFCAIAVHQGRTVRWRSGQSILDEAKELTAHPKFKGIINDVGGPTANMYAVECDVKNKSGACPDKRCLFPNVCRNLNLRHDKQTLLLRKIKRIPGVKKVFVASGIRYDMILEDTRNGDAYLRDLVEHHVSGQLKVAPEHSEKNVLDLMGKPGVESLVEFKKRFDALSASLDKKQFLTYYLIAAHPGCSLSDMRKLKEFANRELRHIPEQIQIFTPTPSTISTMMYWTETDPFSDNPVFVEKSSQGKEKQKNSLKKKKNSPNHLGRKKRGLGDGKTRRGGSKNPNRNE